MPRFVYTGPARWRWLAFPFYAKFLSNIFFVIQGSNREEQPERPSSASERKLEEPDAEVNPSREDWSGLRVVD